MIQYAETPRLILRDWQESDLPLFATMNSDSHVMEYFLKTLTTEESAAFYHRLQDEFDTYGFGLYAIEEKETGSFIGYTGLHHFDFNIDFAPGIEIGWRLRSEAWGKGYATEAATTCLQHTREKLGIKELYSFTSLLNKRSERVMQKIGMERIKEFNHPLVSPAHPLYRHILYKIKW